MHEWKKIEKSENGQRALQPLKYQLAVAFMQIMEFLDNLYVP